MSHYRQAHKKTRTGCSTCKGRHIKCDEQGPTCTNCRVRNLDCDLAKRSGAANSQSGNSEKTNTLRIVGNKLAELDLLHHWCVETCHTITFEEDEEIWLRLVPKLAFKNEYLMNTLLAMTALHMATSMQPSRARPYQLAAFEYQNRAIAAFRAHPPEVTESTYQSVFAFSILNLSVSVAIPYYCPLDVTSESIKENLVTVFQLLQGSVSIVATSRLWIDAGPFRTLIKTSASGLSESLSTSLEMVFARLHATKEEKYRLDVKAVQHSQEIVRSYESNSRAINKLHECFSGFQTEGPLVCFRWLANVDVEFVKAIANFEPFSVLITLHWAVLLDRLGEVKWWAQSSGKLLITELSRDLVRQKPEWHQIISWANTQVGLPPVKIDS